ncbi:Uncharacterised protein [Bordetella pertussis]|nr:Uncharacterised protein [Bordetella pertussis]
MVVLPTPPLPEVTTTIRVMTLEPLFMCVQIALS